MTPEAQRIAIAEACGWKDLKSTNGYMKPKENGKFLIGTKDEGSEREYEFIPDYLGSLDAMHEAEKVLSLNSRYCYIKTLCRTTGGSSVDWMFVHATAPQRAEALLRTLNLWKQ